MNTTDKYIYKRNEIDPLSFKEVGTIELSLEVVNKEIDSFLLSRYKLNKFGNLKSCQRKEFEWIAFPPLNGSIKIIDNERVKKLGFTENFEYQGETLISSVLIDDENKKLKFKVDFKFEESFLSEINKFYFRGEEIILDSQVFTYNTDNNIIKIDRITKVDKHTKIKIETNFLFDKEGLVSEKLVNHLTTIGNSVISYTSNEQFIYNSYQQLEESTQSVKFVDQEVVTKVKFIYLTKECDLIVETRTKEGDTEPTIKEYMYDDNKRLKCVKIENCGNITKTNYNRKVTNS